MGGKTHLQTIGYKTTKLYNLWRNMKQRVLNKHRPDYKNYGGRGIKICEEWMQFNVFFEWANNNGYEDGLEIDRENNNGNYEPDNCHFVTHKENAQNRRRKSTWGIYKVGSKFRIIIQRDDIRYNGGYANIFEEAIILRSNLMCKLKIKDHEWM